MHAARNYQHFLEVRSPECVAVVPVFRDERRREGQVVRLQIKKGRVQSIETLGPEQERGKGPER